MICLKKSLFLSLFGFTACLLLVVQPDIILADNADKEIQKTDVNGLSIDAYPTFGPGGGKRPAIYIPGDALFVAFKISGLKLSPEAKADFTYKAEFFDEEGKSRGELGSGNYCNTLLLGDSCVHFRLIDIQPKPITFGEHFSPGKYTVLITVWDAVAKKKAKHSLSITLLPKGTFGATCLHFANNLPMRPSIGASALAGKLVFLQFSVTGHTILDNCMQVDVSVMPKTRNGKTLRDKPYVLSINTVVPSQKPNINDSAPAPSMPAYFSLPLTRPGHYVFELKLEDKLSETKRTAEYKIPFIVTAPWDEFNEN